MEIIIVNRSTLCTDDEVRKMTRAIEVQMESSFCPAWDLRAPVVTFAPASAPVNPEAYIVSIADHGTQKGILGYHDEISGAVVDAFVFAAPSLANGGAKMRGAAAGATTVASVLSHEVCEMIVDPCINTWWDGPLSINGNRYESVAAEVGDPVQPSGGREDYYVCTIDGEEYWLANFILPSWRDLQERGPYDFLGKLAHPFSITQGGYLIVRNAPGSEKNEFGARVAPAVAQRAQSEFARRARAQTPAYQSRPR